MIMTNTDNNVEHKVEQVCNSETLDFKILYECVDFRS